jgi:hypothetical protein
MNDEKSYFLIKTKTRQKNKNRKKQARRLKAKKWFSKKRMNISLTWTNSIAGARVAVVAVVAVVVVRLACATAADGRSLKCCTVNEALDTQDEELVLLWARRRPALGLLLLLEMLLSEAEIKITTK